MFSSFNKTVLLTIFLSLTSDALAKNYNAAGVLPYAKDQNDKIMVLLGLSSVHKDHASDFGGFKDASDNNDPKITAAREGCEELLFIFDGQTSFNQLLEKRKKYRKGFDLAKTSSESYQTILKLLSLATTKKVTTDHYVMYFIEIPYDTSLPEQLLERKTQFAGSLPFCWNETSKLAWVPLEKIVATIKKENAESPACINDICLYKPFVHSLKNADSQHIFDQIKK